MYNEGDNIKSTWIMTKSPFVSCLISLLRYNCECQTASMSSCLVSRGFLSVLPIFFCISSTAFSKSARSCSRVRMDCFNLPSLVNKRSTVASRFWIFPLATFPKEEERRRGRKEKKKGGNSLVTETNFKLFMHKKHFPNDGKLQR